MMRWLITFAAIVSICSILHAQAPQGAEQRIGLREVPRELAQQVSAQLGECRKTLPLSQEVANDVRHVITSFDFSKPDTMRALREKMLAVGPGSIPVADEFLQSQDDSLRAKAVFALRCLISNGENTPAEKTSADVLLAKLFHRTVIDRNANVRESAVIALSGLGHAKHGDSPEALLGLREALNDPDPKLRTYVERTIEVLERASNEEHAAQ